MRRLWLCAVQITLCVMFGSICKLALEAIPYPAGKVAVVSAAVLVNLFMAAIVSYVW